MSSTLMLHAGGQKTTREQVFSVEAPPATHSWHPVSHGRVLAKVESALDQAGYNIVRQELALSHSGNRFFGVIDLENTIVPGVSLALGLRNSIDKSFPYGLAGGSRTFVCDNLALTGDLINIRRKHTRNGSQAFVDALNGAIKQLPEFRAIEERRTKFLMDTRLDRHEGEHFLLRAFELGVLSHRILPEAIKQFREPTHDWGDKGTLWHLYNAMTTPLQDRAISNPRSFAASTMRLMGLLLPDPARAFHQAEPDLGYVLPDEVVIDVSPREFID